MKKKIKKISFGLSLKNDKQMRLFFDDKKKNEISLKNRQKFFKKLGKDITQTVSCQLAHGKNVKVVSKKQAGKIMASCDGLVTQEKNLILTVTAADCLPIYFFDYKKSAVGIVHAGWRGVKKEIVKKTIEKMKKNFNCQPKDINVYIGPHIKKCHFEVDFNLATQFKKYKKFTTKGLKKVKIDLGGIVRQQLIEMGIKKANIKISPDCTYCHKKYFSNRRDKPKEIEAMIGYIFLE